MSCFGEWSEAAERRNPDVFSAPTYRHQMAIAGIARVRACVMSLGSWSIPENTFADHKPEPRRLRVISP